MIKRKEIEGGKEIEKSDDHCPLTYDIVWFEIGFYQSVMFVLQSAVPIDFPKVEAKRAI